MSEDYRTGGKWSSLEDSTLMQAIETYGTNWELIARMLPRRTMKMCQNRWELHSHSLNNKGAFTEEEDRIVIDAVKSGITKWSEIAKLLKNRIGKQCRERWYNHLDPNLKKTPWSDAEDLKLIQTQARIGNLWTKIAQELPGRSENEVKNRWNSAPIRRLLASLKSSEDQSKPSTRKLENADRHLKAVEINLSRLDLEAFHLAFDYVRQIVRESTAKKDTLQVMHHVIPPIETRNLRSNRESNGVSLISTNMSNRPVDQSIDFGDSEGPLKRLRSEEETINDFVYKANRSDAFPFKDSTFRAQRMVDDSTPISPKENREAIDKWESMQWLRTGATPTTGMSLPTWDSVISPPQPSDSPGIRLYEAMSLQPEEDPAYSAVTTVEVVPFTCKVDINICDHGNSLSPSGLDINTDDLEALAEGWNDSSASVHSTSSKERM